MIYTLQRDPPSYVSLQRMAVRRSKECISLGLPLQRTKSPEKWYPHEYKTLDELVDTTHFLPDTKCIWKSQGRMYEGGVLTIIHILYKTPLVYIYLGTFENKGVAHEVVIKGSFLVHLKNRHFDWAPRIRFDGLAHSDLSYTLTREEGLPHLFGWWAVGSFAFYVVEKIEQDLYHHILSSPPSLEEVKGWGRQLISILKSLHLTGEHLHMDIKSTNIVIDSSGRLFLIDYECSSSTRLLFLYGSKTGSFFEPEIGNGTKRYKSTQAHHPRVSLPGYHSDIQSLIFVLEEILSEGVLPWDDMDDEETYQAKLLFTPQHPITLRLWEYIRPLRACDKLDYDLLIEYLEG